METIVETSRGRLRGRAEHGVLAFRGIPYAEPPVGRLRFAAPRPARPWAGVRDALRFGAPAPQLPGMLGQLVAGAGDADPAEDCLTLNVFTPATDAGRRPVLVWIHGGGFTSGTGGSAIYDGSELARRGDAVVVTINYRLGALGFLPLEDPDDPGEPCGNFALQDQLAALAFVRDEVERFGGDPERVTLFGESAGAMSIGALLGSPAAEGLFGRAILQSGAAAHVSPPEQADRVAWTLLRELGVPARDAARLRALSVEDLLQAQVRTLGALGRNLSGLAFQPVEDERLLPRAPLEAIVAGSGQPLPLLIGTNLDEYKLYRPGDPKAEQLDDAGLLRRVTRLWGEERASALVAAYRTARSGRVPTDPTELWYAIETDRVFRIPALRLADAVRAHEAPVFVYLFTWASPALDGKLGACHGLDVPFVFGSHRMPALKGFVGEGETLDALSQRMQDAWLAFARSDVPEPGGWPVYDATRPTRILGASCGVELDPGAAERRAWQELL